MDLISAGFEDRLKDTKASLCSAWVLVTPGVAEASLLYQKVVSDGPPCGVRMPVGQALPTEQVQCLKSWIESLTGANPPPTCETCGTTACIDVTSDPTHCGACGSPCTQGQICQNSQCVGCPGGQLSCGGTCIDPQTNNAHCGTCGNACSAGQSCVSGVCQCSAGSSVSFAQQVQPILTTSCGGGACHLPMRGRAAADLNLSPAMAYHSLVNVASSQCSSLKLVLPGDPGNSYLLNKLLGVRMCQGTAMPKGATSLPKDQLDLIGAWVCSGANP
ncbi:MAG: hypothetical protein SFV15_26950 [Polyangiaceae bacterium]|nr:hypothetical protein [Polyangiaceae bacterium]